MELKKQAEETCHKTKHPLYVIWKGIKARCRTKGHRVYGRYGGRGIDICEQWMDFHVFVSDINRLIGQRPEGCSIDRIDNDGDYEPGNVRWADMKTQARNTRSNVQIKSDSGEVATRPEWAERSGLSIDVIRCRLARGLSIDEAISCPARRGEYSGKAKLTNKDVYEIREKHVSGMTLREIATQHGVSKQCIHDIITRRKWSHLK